MAVKIMKESTSSESLEKSVQEIIDYIDDYIRFGDWFPTAGAYNGYQKSVIDTKIFVGYGTNNDNTNYLVIRYGIEPVVKKFSIEDGMLDFVVDKCKDYLLENLFLRRDSYGSKNY